MNPLEGVTLDRLFRPQKDIPILGQVVTVRSLSDTERSERYKRAMLCRAKLSAKLSDKDSDDYAINFGNLSDATDEQMVSAILLFRMRGANIRAESEIPFDFIPIPDGATADETDEVHNQREKSVVQTKVARSEFVSKVVDEAEKTLKTTPRVELEREYRQAIRERLLETAYGDEVVAVTIHFGTNQKFSVVDAREMHSAMRDALWSAIVEVDNIDPLRLSGPALTDTSPAHTI